MDVVGVIVGVVVNIFRGWWVVLVGDLAVLQSMGKKRKCIIYIYRDDMIYFFERS